MIGTDCRHRGFSMPEESSPTIHTRENFNNFFLHFFLHSVIIIVLKK